MNDDARLKYAKAQAGWVRQYKVKVGDKVKVTRAAKADEAGWDNSWEKVMDASVGKTLLIDFIHDDIGLDDDCGYSYPFFVLEKTG